MVELIVADDHVLMREALCSLLQKRGDFHIMGQASDGQELLNLMHSNNHPDVLLLDMEMPNVDGLTALKQLRDEGMKIPVLILSARNEASDIREAIKKGANGYMPKNSKIEELEFAIDSVIKGNTYVSPSIAAALVNEQPQEKNHYNISILSNREIEILKFLGDGHPNKDIAKVLCISKRTVDTHRSNILKKLGIKSNAELAKIAIANGLVKV